MSVTVANESARTETALRSIDTAVHPTFRSDAELREYLPRAYRDRPFPNSLRYLYSPPTGVAPYGTYAAEARQAAGTPGSDPELAARHLAAYGSDEAILLPLARGVLPNLDLGTEICKATNTWLAERWLSATTEVRYHGSIRLNPLDVEGSIAELERWAGDDRMVQVSVPLEAQLPYGHRVYHRLWAAVAASGLPVAVRNDGYSGASFHPTPSGFPRHYAEFAALQQNNYVYHLTSLIAEGVFERLPALRWVFTDGGFDVMRPLMWRMDMDWPITRVETPWVPHLPSDYLRQHVRFVTSPLEGPPDEVVDEWAEIWDAGSLLMYGSAYPMWMAAGTRDLLPAADAEVRNRVLRGTAEEFFALRPRS
jgi:predicted TIM-barrel fold metal-dependent hydrolase